MSKLIGVSIYLGYSVSAIAFVCGIVVMSGVVLNHVPARLRVMFGVVLTLWSIYRFVMTRMRIKQQREDDEE